MEKVSVIIPTLNESKSIASVLKKIPKTYDVIVVDSYSTDGTDKIVKRYGAKLINERRKGYGIAYRTGFKHAKGDIVATLDGDGSYNPNDIKKLIKILKSKKIEFVSGNRLSRPEKMSMSFFRVLGNWFISVFSNILFLTTIHDSQSGMWVFYKNVLKKFKLKENGMSFSSEIKLEAYRKSRFLEYPVSYNKRIGKNKMNLFKQGRKILKFLLKRRFT